MGKLVVGIDLGTTHSVVAFAERREARASVFAVEQLVSATEVAARELFPSFLYAPLEGEGASDPFGDAPWILGEHARRRGSEVPGRLVASAKSWLCHPRVDRTAPILPWGADESTPKLSPLEASERLLRHLRVAWDSAHPKDPLADQEIVLTVPASFDEAARELTALASRRAGLPSIRLLEEPQAAFYDFMDRAGDDGLAALAERSGGDALVLVCDVGGGTTDLSLLRVKRSDGATTVERVAVGRHLLLGGDNMDLALAHALEPSFVSGEQTSLEPSRFGQLVLACRAAKETLLSEDGPNEAAVTLLASGSKLFGGTKTATLTRARCEEIVLEGFFPIVHRGERAPIARSGLVAFGLPYERDVAVTRHVGEFLARHAKEEAPRAVLLNGGVFHASRIADRLIGAIGAWSGAPVSALPLADPDRAVARGAVAFARAIAGSGLRIESNAARSYFIGLAERDGERRAVCVVPRGAKEGERHVAEGTNLALVVGRPVRFDLFASDDDELRAGDLVTLDDDRFDPLPPVAVAFGAGEKAREVRVTLEGELTAIGTLDLACVEREGEARRFKLEMKITGDEQPAARTSMRPSSLPPPSEARSLLGALDSIDKVFGKGRGDVGARDVKDLVRDLEKTLGPRDKWNLTTLRALADALLDRMKGRRRSVDHERVWLQLAGFCLRPGFGDPLDERRLPRLAPAFLDRLAFPDEARSWQAFWIMWRRVAGGLDEATQQQIRDVLDPLLAPAEKRLKKPKGWKSEAEGDLLDFVSSLERLPPSRRSELGAWILERTWTSREPRLWAALGRLGAREPAYASAHHAVAPIIAERWLDHLLREKWNDLPSAPLAATQLARVTGDRARDLSPRIRKEVERRLAQSNAPDAWIRAVHEHVPVGDAERAAFFGDALPAGLRLIDS